MRQKLKNFWENPYAAPLTDPLRNIGKTVAGFVAPYTNALRNTANPTYFDEDKTPIGRFLSSLLGVHNSFLTVVTNFVALAAGAFGAGSIGGVAAYSGLAGAGAAAQWGGAVASGLAAGAVGFMAAPVAMVAVTAFVGIVVGTVTGGVPGLVSGTARALKHHHALKNPPPPAPAAASPTAQQISDETVQRIMKDFRTLPPTRQREVFDAAEHVLGLGGELEARVLNAIDKMDPAQRAMLAEKLEEKLADAFAVVASKKAAEAGVLDEDVTVKPIGAKLRRRNAAPAAGSA